MTKTTEISDLGATEASHNLNIEAINVAMAIAIAIAGLFRLVSAMKMVPAICGRADVRIRIRMVRMLHACGLTCG